MNTTTDIKRAEPSLARAGVALLRHYLGGRRGLIVLTVLAIGAGLAMNWSWLVAAGIAPLLLAVAPCAAMCALGLCAQKMGKKSDAPQPGPDVTTQAPDAPIAAAHKVDTESKS
jgi:hypothetical protein